MLIEREVPEGTKILFGDPEKLLRIWGIISQINGVFDDYTRGRFDSFFKLFSSPDTWWLERDDGNGILYLTMIQTGLSAHAHFIFWDRILRGREQFLRDCITFAMKRFDLRKVNAVIPEYAGALMSFAERVGFKREGSIRNWSFSNNRLYSVAWYGILLEEAMNGPGSIRAEEDRESPKAVRGDGVPNGAVEPVPNNGEGGTSGGSPGDAVLDQEHGRDPGIGSREHAPDPGVPAGPSENWGN